VSPTLLPVSSPSHVAKVCFFGTINHATPNQHVPSAGGLRSYLISFDSGPAGFHGIDIPSAPHCAVRTTIHKSN
jgi:hypothetical protein